MRIRSTPRQPVVRYDIPRVSLMNPDIRYAVHIYLPTTDGSPFPVLDWIIQTLPIRYPLYQRLNTDFSCHHEMQSIRVILRENEIKCKKRTEQLIIIPIMYAFLDKSRGTWIDSIQRYSIVPFETRRKKKRLSSPLPLFKFSYRANPFPSLQRSKRTR